MYNPQVVASAIATAIEALPEEEFDAMFEAIENVCESDELADIVENYPEMASGDYSDVSVDRYIDIIRATAEVSFKMLSVYPPSVLECMKTAMVQGFLEQYNAWATNRGREPIDDARAYLALDESSAIDFLLYNVTCDTGELVMSMIPDGVEIIQGVIDAMIREEKYRSQYYSMWRDVTEKLFDVIGV